MIIGSILGYGAGSDEFLQAGLCLLSEIVIHWEWRGNDGGRECGSLWWEMGEGDDG